ncbi:MAG: hypothetical protein KDA60_22185 [Planctomycetales bacterium]|nr:hypothetical protein [Planctomycetales bacterium]
MQKMIGRLQNVWHMVSGRSQARMDDESSAWAVSLGFHLSVILALGLVSLYRPASETVTLLAPSVPHVEPVIPEQF